MTPQDYIAKMSPFATQASTATGLPLVLILAQWAHESGWGESDIAVHANNHAGIKYTSNADYQYAGYSAYNSLDSFAKDYARVLNLSYYDHIRAAAQAGQPPEVLADLFVHAPPGVPTYAEDPQYNVKLKAVIATVKAAMGPQGAVGSLAPVTVSQTAPNTVTVTSAGQIAEAAVPLILLAGVFSLLLGKMS